MVHKLIVYGRIPSKKNNRRILRVKGRPIISSSERYEEWEKQALIQVAQQNWSLKQEIEEIQIDFTFPDNRKADLTNKAESVMDMLIKCGVIVDDNWKEVPQLMLKSMGIDKHDPKVEIYIRGKC